MMQPQQNIIDCYNKTAVNYADKFGDELSHKHLDSILLEAFARENAGAGKLIDLGCGPGQTTKYLFGCGAKDVVGTDISPQMILVAKDRYPSLNFETADMLSLPYTAESFGAAVAFYSIVHFSYEEIATAFSEVKRILKRGGQFLFSFHIGDHIIHLDNFLDHPVNIDFYFFEVEKILSILYETGFEIMDCIERAPYNGIEYASRRAYIWVKSL
jgi:ubiquinone/menaquinone biosynthesis C-methylase UbiE